jgi:hypothetical protein
MRLNVYAEELRLDRDVEVVSTQVRDEPGIEFKGVRFYLGPDVIHRPGDDDTGGITLWIPRRADGTPDTLMIRSLLDDLYHALDTIDEETGR